MKIVGFVGMPGSGKSVASDMAREMGLTVVVMGDVIRKEAARLGLQQTDENLGNVGRALRAREGPQAIARRTLDIADGSGQSLVVVDGIRSKDEVDYFKAHAEGFCLVEVWTPPQLRLHRIAARGRPDDMPLCSERDIKTVVSCSDALPMAAEALEKRECREMGWGMCEAIEAADFRICNDAGIDEFRSRVRLLLDQMIRDG